MFPVPVANNLLFENLIDSQDHSLKERNGPDNAPSNKATKKRQKKSKSEPKPKPKPKPKPISIQENKVEGSNELSLRKIVHRDIERQRRQEMGTLYASLRSLLPLECVQGKRSISDHMHQAVNYIEQMQKKIKDLQMRKNKLIKMRMAENGSSDIVNSFPNCVSVECLSDSVEILINSGINEEGFPLSRVMLELVQTGLDVISCVSTKTNQRILYRIESEAVDLDCINLSVLQRRLANAINFG